ASMARCPSSPRRRSPCWSPCRCCPTGGRRRPSSIPRTAATSPWWLPRRLPCWPPSPCGLGEQVAFSFLPVYAVGAGVSAETGALWLSTFVLGNVILQWPIGWMADHFDRRVVLAGCTLISALLVVVLSLVSAQSLLIIAVIGLWGGLSFAIYPVGLALLGQQFRDVDMARANTAFSMLYIMGGLVGRPLAGGAMDAMGDPGLGWTLALFYAAAGLAALLAFHRLR